MMDKLIACYDPNHEGNSSIHWTGKECVENGCHSPAGTAWSPYWCFEHNMQRMKRIDASFEAISEKTGEAGMSPAFTKAQI